MEFIYLSTGLVYVYTVYRLMSIFFGMRVTSKRIELLSYVTYYLVTSAIYLFLNIPVFTLIANVILMTLISFNYKAAIKDRVMGIFMTYLILMISETIVSISTGLLGRSVFTENPIHPSALGYILARLVGFFVAIFLENHKNVRNGHDLPIGHWILLVVIAFSSMYIVSSLVNSNMGPYKVSIIISLLLLIIIILFVLYDGLKNVAELKLEKSILAQENKYYTNQFRFMKSSQDSTQRLKHDIRNHIAVLGGLVKMGETGKVLDYIERLEGSIGFNKIYAESHNPVIDSIVNYKLGALPLDIIIHSDVHVPSDLELDAFDMTKILGNLLDNAIEAVGKIKEEKVIWVTIKYDRGKLTICIKNTFDGYVAKDSKGITTTKLDKDKHGIGLSNVETAVKKYDGDFEYHYADNIFESTVTIYV